ncbi:MAG: hydrogenase expression/formation protein HypE [Kiritimatiellae bacterium]|nr:hydrogenase expression/formation protein HypE [Kiritimatiellia bacterium]
MKTPDERVQLAHGGGGRLMAEFIETHIRARFGDGPLRDLPDAARLRGEHSTLLFTADSYVVQPRWFPGGDIGALAVHGTVNDLAVCGGRARWLALSLILEEGLPLAEVGQVLDSVAQAARRCGVQVVTGDTKVVGRGQCDGMFVNTAGIGEPIGDFVLSRDTIRVGDRVLVSGPIGDHGLAVMAAREGLAAAGSGPVSDSAPVVELVEAIAELAGAVRWMRDPTRGGVAAVLNECVRGRDWSIEIIEERLPVAPPTAALADLLGIDVLQAACEGRLIAVCAPEVVGDILGRWCALEEGRGAAEIGRVVEHPAGVVVLATRIGGRRLVDLPRGELLPRIC